MKSIASGNPAFLTLAESEAKIQRLAVLRKSHLDEQFLARRKVRELPGRRRGPGRPRWAADRRAGRTCLDGSAARWPSIRMPGTMHNTSFPWREGRNMQNGRCPKCGHETAPDMPCSGCGQTAVNGAVENKRVKPAAPPEAARWVIEPVPPEVREHFLRTFNEEEYLAEARETLATGGADIDALIAEIEQKVDGNA